MMWFTTNTTYDDFPLYLRRPDFKNIWIYKDRFPNIFCITHELEKVKQNGLPESDYNESLEDFDYELVNLFDQNNDGLIVLVETYCGKRNYWFYISNDVDYNTKIKSIKNKFPLNTINIKFGIDSDWGFLKEYPIKLYSEN